jgi:sugar lactone lactonase YvrE
LNQPFAIAVDGDGKLFIADFANHRVRKVTTGGIITTVAGNGQFGFSGDGSPADGVQLRSPFDVAVTAAGDMLIASNGRIRIVGPTGIITSAAGTGTGDFGGDGGPAVSRQTELVFPTSVTLDKSGNLFIVDSIRIRKVSSDRTITTVAGNGDSSIAAVSSQLGLPSGIAVDSESNLFVADGLNHRILKVSPNGMITTVAGKGTPGFSGDGGPALSAQLTLPSALALDVAGNLFIADNGNHRIRKISVSGVISTVAGTGVSGFGGDGGPATSALIRAPNGVAIDTAGNLFIADTGDNRIRKVNASGMITTVAGNGTRGLGGEGSSATSAQLNAPVGIAIDATGNLFVADSGNHRIRKITPAGIITTIAGNGSLGFSGDGGSTISAQLSQPSSVATDSTGNLFVIDNSKRIRKITFSGSPDGR